MMNLIFVENTSLYTIIATNFQMLTKIGMIMHALSRLSLIAAKNIFLINFGYFIYVLW